VAARKRKKRGGKWIQAASRRMARKGTKGSYGHHSVAQMKRDKAKGGAIGKKANFALSMKKIASRRKKRTTTRRRKRTAHR
jgi:hypothetical protein